MSKITTLDALKKIKEATQTSAREEGRNRVVIGLGTCGIAAGARNVMQAILEELRKRDIKDVSVETTGCRGLCQKEPLVDVIRNGESAITYGPVKVEDAARLVANHIVNGNILEDIVIGRID